MTKCMSSSPACNRNCIIVLLLLIVFTPLIFPPPPQFLIMPSAYLMLAVVTLLVAISSTGCSAQCNGTLSCFPPLGDLTLNRTFSVNSTCSEGEEYILSGPNLTCDPSLNSPLSINDDDESTYWVSKVNSNFELPFFVQLNFEAPVFFYSTEIKWSSRTPTAMRLERYTGTTWAPYRYFANNCNESYSLSDSPIIPDQPLTNQVPVCTSMELRGTPGGIVSMRNIIIQFKKCTFSNENLNHFY